MHAPGSGPARPRPTATVDEAGVWYDPIEQAQCSRQAVIDSLPYIEAVFIPQQHSRSNPELTPSRTASAGLTIVQCQGDERFG